MKHLVYTLTLAILLSGCYRSSFNEEITSVDSLITEYNLLKIVVDSMNFDEAKLQYNEYESLMRKSRMALENLNPKDIKDATFINKLKLLKRSLNPYIKTHRNLTKNIPRNIQELKHLKNDISNNAYDKSEVNNFIAKEKLLLNDSKEAYKIASDGFSRSDTLLQTINQELENISSY